VTTASPEVLLVVPRDGLGGAETAARSAAKASPLDCDLVVMFLAGKTLAKDRRRIIDYPKRSLKSPTTYIEAAKQILQYKPDVLVCSLWRSVLVGLVVKLVRPQTRFVCLLHLPVPAHIVDRIVHDLALVKADEVWADSAATLAGRGRAIPKGTRSRIISFVTSHPKPAKPPVLAPRFVNWSRLHPQKGHDRAIRLMDALVRRGVDAQLEIWGADNGVGPALKDLAKGLGLEARIRFLGPLAPEDIPSVAAKNSFFLQLSRTEGMAMAVVEGMQLGLVPVVTAVGQMRDYVRQDVTGIIVDPAKLDETAEQLVSLLANPETFAAMSRASASTWVGLPTYAEDVCAAARELSESPSPTEGDQPRGTHRTRA
jgi:glycosyltransferase involved in cell wall biosynthesis